MTKGIQMVRKDNVLNVLMRKEPKELRKLKYIIKNTEEDLV